VVTEAETGEEKVPAGSVVAETGAVATAEVCMAVATAVA
jgi:hypothetical protein